MEREMKGLKEAAWLFEVTVSDFKQLKACRHEIAMLKTLWDMVILVQSSFSDWNTRLWSDINVEQMDIDCKKFVKDIRTLDKEMRAWNVFVGKTKLLCRTQLYLIQCLRSSMNGQLQFFQVPAYYPFV